MSSSTIRSSVLMPSTASGELGAPLVAEALGDDILDSSITTSRMRSSSLASRSFRSAIFARSSSSSSSHLLALERGQRAQAHLEDRVGLALAELEARHQLPRAVAVSSEAADDRDDLVEVVEGDREALEEMGPRLGLREVVGRAPDDHLAAEVDEVAQRLLDRQKLRATVHQRQQFTPKVVCSGVIL